MSDAKDLRSRFGLKPKETPTPTPNPNADTPPAGGTDDPGADDPGAGGDADDTTKLKDNPASGGTGDDTGGTDGGGADDKPKPTAHTTPPAEPTDEDILANLRKINPNIKSLDDIKGIGVQPEDEATKRKKRANSVLKFGLDKELISREEYDEYQRDNAKTPRQIVYEDYQERRKGKATPEKIDREFAKLYHEDIDLDAVADEDEKEEALSITNAAKEAMEREAKRIIKRRHAKVFQLDNQYENHVSEQQRKADQDRQILDNVKLYKADVEAIFQGISKSTYKVGDEQSGEAEEFDFEYSKEVLDSIKNEFLKTEVAGGFIANYSKAVLQDAIQLRLKSLTEDQRISHVAKRYAASQLKKVKIGRSHLSVDDPGRSTAPTKIDSPLRQRVQEYLPEPKE